MQDLTIVTDFGDGALLLPLSVAILAWLVLQGARRAALWWAAALALAIGGTALLKLYFHVCSPFPMLRSPSGHTSLATLVYGALAVVLAAEVHRAKRLLVIGGTVSVVAAIAVSRVLLQAHTVQETVLGSLIGGCALSVFVFGYLRNRPASTALWPLFLVVALPVAAFHGRQIHAEGFLQALAVYLNGMAGVCG